MPKLSKRLASLASKIEDRVYDPLEAIALVKGNANAKFDAIHKLCEEISSFFASLNLI